MNNAMPLLHVNNVSKSYNPQAIALRQVEFTVEPGEFVSIIGPSGAGKSTLLRCINRLIEMTSGEILIDGMAVSTLTTTELRALRRSVGMVFQHYNLVNRLSVIENVLHGRLGYKSWFAGTFGVYSAAEKQQAMDTLETVGLYEHMYKRCDQLSGGQKQRVGIARALVQNPRIMLCDEPIASLDPGASKIVMDTLKQINNTLGITIIANLHQVHVATEYSSRIIGINAGSVVFDGPPNQLTIEIIQQIYGSEAEELILAYGDAPV